MIKAIYPGSFDPVTKGHLDIIKRASDVLDHLTVVALENPRKNQLFSSEERVQMLQIITKNIPNVEVDYFKGLLVDYVSRKNARIIVKGLRAISDFEFEFQMALVNRRLNSQMETFFMMTNSKYAYLSSSIVKEVACMGGDVREMLPPEIYDIVIEKLRHADPSNL